MGKEDRFTDEFKRDAVLQSSGPDHRLFLGGLDIAFGDKGGSYVGITLSRRLALWPPWREGKFIELCPKVDGAVKSRFILGAEPSIFGHDYIARQKDR